MARSVASRARAMSWRKSFAAAILWLCVPVVLGAQSGGSEARFTAVMPLGSDSMLLQPAKQRLNMLLSLECPELEKVIVKGMGKDKTVSYSDGSPLKYYPSDLSFRFTIGSRTASDEPSPYDVDTKDNVDHFQSNLHFRLKVFHGIEAKTYEPVEARMIGVPADVPYDERIYHLSFKLKDVPVRDRMMLEILDDSGNRVAKFHLQFM